MNVDPDTNESSFSVGLSEDNVKTFATKEEAFDELRRLMQHIKDQHQNK